MITQTFSKITSVSILRKNIKEIPKVGGVYKHYIDVEGLKYLDDVHPTTKEIAKDGSIVYLLYIGKATNLFDRFKWHLGMSNTSPKQIYDGCYQHFDYHIWLIIELFNVYQNKSN